MSTENKNDIRDDQIKFSSLSPSNILKLKGMYFKDSSFSPDKKQFMSLTGTQKRETDIIFDYFDMDGNNQIDSYEFICMSAMLVHASIDLRSEFLFKLYDLDNNNFLTRDELVFLIRNVLLANKKSCSTNDVEKKADEILKSADMDLDRKLSYREFQNYVYKSKEILSLCDQYYILTSDKNEGTNNDNNDENINQFNEENMNADEMDPDLMNEINRDIKEDDDERLKIKEGADFKTVAVVEEGMFKSEDILQATEFSACKPWMGVVMNGVPSDYKPNKSDSNPPDAQLELEYIHGYRTHDTRNNLRYTSKNEIAYHTAAVGIIYNKEEHKQRFMFDHIDDIISLAIHPNKQIIATGEIGPYPLICIWDSETNTSLVRLIGPLTKGITHLAFTPDGKYLIATSLHDDHHIAVFEWEKGSNKDYSEMTGKVKLNNVQGLYATNKGPRANILHIASKSNTEAALLCVKEVNIVTWSKGNLKIKKATGMKNLQTVMCGIYLDNTLVTGVFSGELFLFSGASYSKSVKAHSSSVNCIINRTSGSGFITGGSDGMIFIWDDKFKKINKLSIIDKTINSFNPKVRSVCENDAGNILVGIRGGEIVEFEGSTPSVLIRGHFDNELWGLACHPNKEKYYTCGQDKVLALWDVTQRSIEKFTTVSEAIEVIAVSNDGKHLALGSKTGVVYIYDANSLVEKSKKTDRKQPISEIKFSPDNNYLAVGSVDFMIFIYDKKFNLLKKMKGHVSRVTHMDFAEDSSVMQSNSTSYDILYHNIETGKQVPGGASAYKDEKWFTYTNVLGWHIQGIWPPCASGDDINALDRDKSCKVVATGDDWGKVKLFKYPCPIERSGFNKYVGHSSHVTNVRFTSTNNYLISTGGNDKAIFQWKFIKDKDDDNEDKEVESDKENEYSDEEEVNTGKGAFKEEEMQEGDQFGASKPFLGEVKASTPKNFKISKDSGDAPSENLTLKYVHGYRAFDTRSNIKYSKSGKIVFHAAALGISLDKNNNTQQFFTGHEEDIVALAIHPSKQIIATGQMAQKGKAKLIDIFVWEIETNKILANLKGFLLRAVRNLSFSPSGKYLLCGGQDDDNSIAVYDWEINKILCTSPVDKARIMDCGFSSETEFTVVGLKCVKFFTMQGRNVNVKKGVFGSIKSQQLLCMCFSDKNMLISGSTIGNIIVWSGKSAIKEIKAHTGAVFTLHASKNKLIYSGGEDGIIKIFSSKMELKEQIDTTKMTPFKVGVRAIDLDDNGMMIIGTRGGDIIEMTSSGKKNVTILQSHYDTELWALTVNPSNSCLFASGGGDCTLRVWDAKKNVMIKSLILDQDFRAIDWSNDGKFIIIGSMLGKIYYVDYASFKVVSSIQSMFKSDKQWIQELKISPDCQYAAYGSHGCVSKVEIVKISPKSSKPIQVHAVINPRFTSSLTHLDWSKDSNSIVVNSLAFELKFLNLESKNLISASASVDIEWNTWTCLFGFPVQGIWPPASTGYVVNYTCASNNRKILATGDDFSLVKLFKYPCVVEKAKFKSFKGHSSHIPKIRFSSNDCYLFSTGGNDKCVFVWETDFGTEDNKNDDSVDLEKEKSIKQVSKNKKSNKMIMDEDDNENNNENENQDEIENEDEHNDDGEVSNNNNEDNSEIEIKKSKSKNPGKTNKNKKNDSEDENDEYDKKENLKKKSPNKPKKKKNEENEEEEENDDDSFEKNRKEVKKKKQSMKKLKKSDEDDEDENEY